MAEPAVTLDERPVAARRPLQRRSARRIAARLAVDAMAVSSAMFISSILYFELELFGERLPTA